MEYFNIYADAKQSALEIRSNTSTHTRAVDPKHFDYLCVVWKLWMLSALLLVSSSR